MSEISNFYHKICGVLTWSKRVLTRYSYNSKMKQNRKEYWQVTMLMQFCIESEDGLDFDHNFLADPNFVPGLETFGHETPQILTQGIKESWAEYEAVIVYRKQFPGSWCSRTWHSIQYFFICPRRNLSTEFRSMSTFIMCKNILIAL